MNYAIKMAGKSLLFIGASFLMTFFMQTLSGERSIVNAACGATGGPHGYAGVVLDVIILNPDGTKKGEGTGGRFNINTLDPRDGAQYPPTSPGGNIYNLNNGQRFDSANFSQISNGECNNINTDGSESLILGYGTTSQPIDTQGNVTSPGRWSLDCDLSVHPGVTQKFRITAMEPPANAGPGQWRLYTASGQTGVDSRTANSVIIGPANGVTAYVVLAWQEDPTGEDEERDPPKVTFSLLNCDRVNWKYEGSSTKYRVIVSVFSGDGSGKESMIIGPWNNGRQGDYSYDFSPKPNRKPIRAFAQVETSPGVWGTMLGTTVYYNAPATSGNYVSLTPGDQFPRCAPDNQPSSVSASMSCGSITISVRDQDLNALSPLSSSRRYTGYFEVFQVDNNGELLQILRNDISEFVTPNGDGNTAITKSLSIQPTFNNGLVARVYINDVNSAGAIVGAASPNPAEASTGPCYAGACIVNAASNVDNAPVGGRAAVKAGQEFSVSYVVSNSGQVKIPDNGVGLTATPQGSLNDWSGQATYRPSIHTNSDGGNRVHVGQFTLRAPNNVSSSDLRFYPDFIGRFGVGPECVLQVDTYRPFDLEPRVTNVTGEDSNNPSEVLLRSSVTKRTVPGDTGDPVNVPGVTITRKIFNKRPDPDTQVGPNFATSGYTVVNPADIRDGIESVSGPTVNFRDTHLKPDDSLTGDEYCGTVSVEPAAGWVGPNNARIDTLGLRTDVINACDGSNEVTFEVKGLPYVKVYGGGVLSGFATVDGVGACEVASPTGGIFAHMRPRSENNSAGNKSGSGAQGAAFAYGSESGSSINGFATAILRGSGTPVNGTHNGLTFSNVGHSQTPVLSPKLGTPLTVSRPCLNLQAVFEGRQNAEILTARSGSELNLATLNAAENIDKQSKYTLSASQDLTITGGDNYEGRHTVFVDGDVQIRSNISYNPAKTTAATPLNQQPSLTFIVRGNIYIDPGVTKLDGVFVTEPRRGADGVIAADTGLFVTCSINGQIFGSDAAQRRSLCQQKLTVVGSVTAYRVLLERSFGDIRESTFAELVGSNRSAEEFIYVPDLNITTNDPKGDDLPQYDSILKLPPIL